MTYWITEHGMAYSLKGSGSRSLGSSRGSDAPKGDAGKAGDRAKPGRCLGHADREVYEMYKATTERMFAIDRWIRHWRAACMESMHARF